MKGAIIYFTGTGNTEFAAKQFKSEFEKRGVQCSLIDIRRKRSLNDDYDFFVFGSPIHAELFPRLYIDWVKDKLTYGNNRRCIIFSTQAADKASGAEELRDILIKKNFNVDIIDYIKMPNNYYVVAFNRESDDGVKCLKEKAANRVSELIDFFLNGKKILRRISKLRLYGSKLVFKGFNMYSHNWAKRSLSVDQNICVKCGKCVKNCPTLNITLDDKITFKSKCISCQRCLHSCPVNAFLYKGKTIKQYRL